MRGALTGNVVIEPACPTVRCSVPTREQPGMPADADVIRTVKHHSDRCLGVYANVGRGGRLAVGDELELRAPASRRTSRRVQARKGRTRWERG